VEKKFLENGHVEPQEGDGVIMLECAFGKMCVHYMKWLDMVVTSSLL
jgi:hypothetical protein